MLAGISMYAQGHVVTGQITDKDGNPLPDAVVMLSGSTTVAAVADINGYYKITVPDAAKARLTVSMISFKTVEKHVSGKAKVNFVLEDDSKFLDEVVVVGYGAMRRSDLTGSVTSVAVSEDDAAQSSSIDQLLQGKAAGVQVLSNSAAPDAAVNIRIRGMSSLTGSSEPLYVVDGVILTSSNSSSMLSYGSDNSDADEASNALMGLNPRDIASIEILKDASATAIYGSEGANGVVLITTKMAKHEKPYISFSAGLDYVTMYKRFPMLSFDEYVDYLEHNKLNEGSDDILKRIYDGYEGPDNRGTLKVTPVDWQDYSLRNTFRQRYYFSVSGNPKTLYYNFSIGYNKNEGIVKTTGSNQLTMRLNLEKTIMKKLKVGAKLNFSNIDSKGQQGANGGRQFASSSMMRSLLVSKPYYSGNLDDYDEADEDWDTIDEDSKSTSNRWIKDSYSNRFEYRFTPNMYLDWTISKVFDLRVRAGADWRMTQRDKWKGASINRTAGGATASVNNDEALRWNADAMLNFKKTIGRGHNLSGTLGATYTSNFSSSQSMLGYNIKQYELKGDNINSAPNTAFAYSESLSTTLSAFLRAIYNYRDRYVLTATIRTDGSSRFKGKNKFSWFPSFAAAWRINQEPWFKVSAISTAKLRLGWGQVGNAGVSPYQTYITFGSKKYPSHDPNSDSGYAVGIIPSNIANPDLKWETTQQWNLGLDLGMWKGRLSLSVDLYDKMTYDLLNSKNIAVTSGYSSMWVNQGVISNRGLELTVNAVPVKIGEFEWGIDGNISFNRNSIINIGTDSEGEGIYLHGDELTKCNYYLGAQIGGGRYFAKCVNIFAEGQPIGLFYGIRTDGIVQEGETGPGFTSGAIKEAGSIKYCDLNGNGFIDDDDRTIIGDPNPDFTYGFSTNFTWKDLTLSMAFNGSYGNDICNSNLNQLLDTQYTGMYNIRRDVYYNAWTPENKDSKLPGLGKYVSNLDSQWFSSINVEDGSYLRLAKISLSYKIRLKKSFVRNITIGASANNVYIWTKYSGWDPDVNSFGSNMKRIGIDNGSYPSSRMYCFDLRFAF